MKIKILIFLIFLIIILNGCTINKDKSNNTNNIIRLANNYNDNWANEAIGYSLNTTDIKYVPKIAVLDTGCNLQNKFITAIYNVSNSDNADVNNHGTVIISKIIELNENIEVIPIKISDSSSEITEDNFYKGIMKAIELNVDIINISIGTEINYDSIESAIRLAINNNILVVSASGNYGGDLLYPAKYDNVISVMARDINNIDLPFNCKSEDKKSFSAPGEHVLCNDKYITGTSIATTYITCAVAKIINELGLIKSKKVYDILINSCNYNTTYSYGIINYKKIDDNIKALNTK